MGFLVDANTNRSYHAEMEVDDIADEAITIQTTNARRFASGNVSSRKYCCQAALMINSLNQRCPI